MLDIIVPLVRYLYEREEYILLTKIISFYNLKPGLYGLEYLFDELKKPMSITHFKDVTFHFDTPLKITLDTDYYVDAHTYDLLIKYVKNQ